MGTLVYRQGEWQDTLSRERVVEFMARHDMQAEVYADMVDHDAFDAGVMQAFTGTGCTMAVRASVGLGSDDYEALANS